MTSIPKRHVLIAAAAGLALAAAPITGAGAIAPAQLAPLHSAAGATVVPDSYLVVLKAGATSTSVDSAASLASAAGGTVTAKWSSAINGYAATLSASALAKVRASADVAYVEPNAIAKLDAEAGSVSGEQPGATWGIDRVDQRKLPLNQTYKYKTTGKGATVYVIDTGVRFSHSEFEGRAISGPDFYDDDDDSSDCHGHGTHVAGTVAGKTYGVAKEATIVGIRTIDCGGYGDTADTVSAIDWVRANASGPSVINMSLRFPASTAMDTAVKNATDAGVVSAVAAGNFSQDACIESPAREPSAFTVGASDAGDRQAGFSNYGRCVDIYAPGVNILSAGISSDTATATMSGTSMASPHVAGGVALFYASHPGADAYKVMKKVAKKASKDKLTGLGAGSPNLLLFTKKF